MIELKYITIFTVNQFQNKLNRNEIDKRVK